MLTPLLHTAHHSFSCRKLGVAFADRLKARTFGRTVADAVEQHNGTLVLFKVFLTVLAESRCSHRAVHTERQSARRQNRPGAKALHLSTSAHTGSALERGSSSFSRQCQSAWRRVCEPSCRPVNRHCGDAPYAQSLPNVSRAVPGRPRPSHTRVLGFLRPGPASGTGVGLRCEGLQHSTPGGLRYRSLTSVAPDGILARELAVGAGSIRWQESTYKSSYKGRHNSETEAGKDASKTEAVRTLVKQRRGRMCTPIKRPPAK